jgi:hypothetical protein
MKGHVLMLQEETRQDLKSKSETGKEKRWDSAASEQEQQGEEGKQKGFVPGS